MRKIALSIAGFCAIVSLAAVSQVSAAANTNTNSITVYGGSQYPWMSGNGWNTYYYYNYPTYTQYPAPAYYTPAYSTYFNPTIPYNSAYYRRLDTFGDCTTYGIFSRYNPREVSGCECISGYQWNADGTECVPYRSRNVTRDFGSGCFLSDGRWSTYWNDGCRCYTGSQEGRWNQYRQCMPIQNSMCSQLDANAYYDSQRDACLCRAGYRTDTYGRSCIYDGTSRWSADQRELRY